MSADRVRSAPRAQALSVAAIVAAAIEILDGGGDRALTFRALGARLSTGIGALQWHVSDRGALMSAIVDEVMRERLESIPPVDAPDEAIRVAGMAFYDLLLAHPWLGVQLAQEPWQLGVMRLYERVGQHLPGLGVPEDRRFDVATAVVGYLLGLAGQFAAATRLGLTERTGFLTSVQESWRSLDADRYPFVHTMADALPHHDDRRQFRRGLDLVLAGIAADPSGASGGRAPKSRSD